MSEAVDWFPGMLAFLAAAGSLTLSGSLVRRLVHPGWSGPSALLADLVLGVSFLFISAELLGIFGLLNRPALLVLAGLILLVCASAFWRSGQAASGTGDSPLTLRRLTVPVALGLAALLLVASQWIPTSLNALEAGMYGGDTLWYHMPFSAHFAQTGGITDLLFVDTQYLHWFYPQNSELFHAAALVLVGSDVLSPVINFFWLALAVLAGWCVGRPYGAALPAAISVALLMSLEVLAARQPGGANNDAMVIALLLSALALAASFWRKDSGFPSRATGPLVIASLAIGLAIGTKLTALAPGLILLAGFIFMLPRGGRLRGGILLALAAAATGSFWFVRNLIFTGNPLPWLSFGPLEKAGELTGREPKPILDYLADFNIWSEWFVPGLSDRLGPFWLGLLVCAIAGLVLGLLSRDRLRIVIAVSGFAALLAYLLIPLGAAGPDGSPTAFAVNIRYITPALALGFISLTFPPGRIDERTWRLGVTWLFSLVLAASLFGSRGLSLGGYPVTTVILAFALLAGLPAAVAFFLVLRSRAKATLVAVIWLVGIFTLGSWQAERYTDFRYSSESPRYPTMNYPSLELQQGIGPLNDLARDLKGQRIGLSGSLAQYYQYGVWGADQSNEVEAIGIEADSGDIRPPASCGEWVQALRAGDFDLVVTSPPVPDRDPETTTTAAEEGWISQASAELVLRRARLAVWKVNGRSKLFSTCGF